MNSRMIGFNFHCGMGRKLERMFPRNDHGNRKGRRENLPPGKKTVSYRSLF